MTSNSTEHRDLLYDRRAVTLKRVFDLLGPSAALDPQLGEIVNRLVDQRFGLDAASATSTSRSADSGLSNLIGLNADAPATFAQTEFANGVIDYDDTVPSSRVVSSGDLYYICIHERLGVFRVMSKLQDLFRAGSIRISDGPGAVGLYRYDKKGILRYGARDRFRAYRRVFGYTKTDPGPDARPNPEFHGLFSHFIGETAKFWRDKRISEVIRERATDPTFGSIAIVRRAGLDLRNNLKNSSYGYINVLRIEMLQALAEAFRVLEAEDVKSQFGAANAWEVIELVLWQYFHESVHASTMNRMAVTGRDIIQWLALPYVLETNRAIFEANLINIAEAAEEWISSEEGMRLSRPTPPPRNVYVRGAPPSGARRDPIFARAGGRIPVARPLG